MKKLNNKGFTLVELIATIVILSLVLTLGTITITTIINSSKEKDYELLIKEIKNSVEELYIECTYSQNDSIDCPTKEADDFYHITLQYLLDTGFLKGNNTIQSNDPNQHGKYEIINPKDGETIGECGIKYQYNGELIIKTDYSPKPSCPQSY